MCSSSHGGMCPQMILSSTKGVEAKNGRRAFFDVEKETGSEIARGVTNYSGDDARRIMGHRSSEIAAILGSMDYEELVHRNNMALL